MTPMSGSSEASDEVPARSRSHEAWAMRLPRASSRERASAGRRCARFSRPRSPGAPPARPATAVPALTASHTASTWASAPGDFRSESRIEALVEIGRHLERWGAPARLVGRLRVGHHVFEGAGTAAGEHRAGYQDTADGCAAPRAVRRRAGFMNSTMSTSTGISSAGKEYRGLDATSILDQRTTCIHRIRRAANPVSRRTVAGGTPAQTGMLELPGSAGHSPGRRVRISPIATESIVKSVRSRARQIAKDVPAPGHGDPVLLEPRLHPFGRGRLAGVEPQRVQGQPAQLRVQIVAQAPRARAPASGCRGAAPRSGPATSAGRATRRARSTPPPPPRPGSPRSTRPRPRPAPRADRCRSRPRARAPRGRRAPTSRSFAASIAVRLESATRLPQSAAKRGHPAPEVPDVAGDVQGTRAVPEQPPRAPLDELARFQEHRDLDIRVHPCCPAPRSPPTSRACRTPRVPRGTRGRCPRRPHRSPPRAGRRR